MDDLSIHYIGTPLEGLDAYERQLKRFEVVKMSKLDSKQNFCGTCKDWKNHDREINICGQVFIPDNSNYGICQNAAHFGHQMGYNQSCLCHRPLNNSVNPWEVK